MLRCLRSESDSQGRLGSMVPLLKAARVGLWQVLSVFQVSVRADCYRVSKDSMPAVPGKSPPGSLLAEVIVSVSVSVSTG